ncbi:uncharacterized protein TEOVI_000809700 [Trypanosoma equiperdum]|uniref:Uncharacterized protein n=2 Tax=Trypanozoon TaxID=39700 RepID=Q581S5_TRYB2|nr:hypothetical protein, conserved [Trypanosoma brucei brucei TREU927]AAX79895.1 hypothetical protein, conserved [Trypanosoma brucei]AAZ10747.1 hypothetical protein, conserved [Trypanosoma brucei brucei TREU927]SCU67563.1 hypothetical protein, conserved [Trypanosoma equiperdum]
MSDLNFERPFFMEFGDFKNGYNREEAEAGINEAIRKQRKLRLQSHVEGIMLGCGIGEAAKQSVHKGVYKPQTTINPSLLCEEDAQPSAGGDEVNSNNGGSRPCPPLDGAALLETSPSAVMKDFATVDVQVETLQEVAEQLDQNIRVARERIGQGCAPFTFEDVLEALTIVLTVVEKGDPTVKVLLPIQPEGSEPLEGAEEVADFAYSNIVPLTVALSSTIYATEWMLQYTLTFINSIGVETEEEAQLHLELRARCVRLLGEINRFTAFAIAFKMKCEMYVAFDDLRNETEFNIGGILDSVEEDLKETMQLQFPRRRRRVLKVQRSIFKRLQRALVLLHELDTCWTPVMMLQKVWKDEFLAESYERIYTIIAPTFFSATLGFVDSSLYIESDSSNSVPEPNNPSCPIQRAPSQCSISRHGRQVGSAKPRVVAERQSKKLVLGQVKTLRVEEKRSFEKISYLVKGTVNRTVGMQLCLGARYSLVEFGEEHDKNWDFVANEPKDPQDVNAYVMELVKKFIRILRQRTKNTDDTDALVP